MAKPGPRTTPRYSLEFKATAVRLSQNARERVASEQVVAFLLSRNNGIEMLDVFVKPHRAEAVFLLAEKLVQPR